MHGHIFANIEIKVPPSPTILFSKVGVLYFKTFSCQEKLHAIIALDFASFCQLELFSYPLLLSSLEEENHALLFRQEKRRFCIKNAKISNGRNSNSICSCQETSRQFNRICMSSKIHLNFNVLLTSIFDVGFERRKMFGRIINNPTCFSYSKILY